MCPNKEISSSEYSALFETLKSLENSFEQNELAFLAATSKVECPIRDKWAYMLWQNLPAHYHVAREWKRTDLAILNNSTPEVLIELKAMYTLDAINKPIGINGYIEQMNNDAVKAKLLAVNNSAVYTVLLATHPKQPYPYELEGVLKYLKQVNKCFNVHYYEGKIKMKATQAVNDNLQHKHVVTSGTINAGVAFGIEFEVLYWVVKEQ